MRRWLILIILCCLSGSATAQMRGQLVCTSGCPMTLGLNLEGPAYFSEEQTFVNKMTMADDWFCASCSWGTQPTFDSAGYPINMAGNTKICTQMLYTISTTPTTDYLIKYSGDSIHPIADAGTLTKIGYYSGTMIDTTPGRYIYQTTEAPGFCITADDPNATGNYIRNIAVINCGTTPSSCANETLWDNCTQINQTCLDPIWATSFGTKSVGGPGFSSYRFMDWMNTYNSITNFAQRSIPNFFTYASQYQPTGIPLEVIASVINQTCVDGWINVPGAAITVTTDGTFTGVITGGSSSGTLTATGLSGSILPRSTSHEGDYLSWSGGTQYGLYVTASLGGGQYTVAMPNGGAVASQTSIAMTASYVPTAYIQSMATVMQANIVWCNSKQKLRVEVANEPWNFTVYAYTYFGGLAQSLWGVGGIDGGYTFRGMITAIAGNIFKTTFGAQASHIEAVVNIQGVTDTNYATDGNKLVVAPYWAGTPANTQIDAGAISVYYTLFEYNLPYNWLTLPDGGLANLLSELEGGALVNNQIGPSDQQTTAQTAGSGYAQGYYFNVPLTTTSGSGSGAYANFSVNSSGQASAFITNNGSGYTTASVLGVSNSNLGGSGSGWSIKPSSSTLPMTDVNQTGGTSYVCASTYPCSYNFVPMTVTGTGTAALGTCTVQTANGPIQCQIAQNGSDTNGGQNFTVGDTLAITSNTSVGGSGSGWAGTVEAISGADTNGNQIVEAGTLAATWKSYLSGYGMKLYAYETGEQILLAGGASPMLTLLCAWDSYSAVQTFTYNYLQQWRANAGQGALANYFQDVSTCGYPSSWGLQQVTGTASPKYNGALQQLQFLLNRDLPGHPANDDRPVGLDMTG